MPDDRERLRVALVGCHRMVTPTLQGHNWAAAFAAVPETALVAACDYGAETRATVGACWGVPVYDDYARMLREMQPDLVCVATRQTLHAEQVEQAIQAGARGILLDKPLATSLAEADRLLAACRGRAALAFGLDRRWSARYQALRRLVAEGAVGSVQEIIATGLPNLINHGCHWYDTLLLLVGDPEPRWVSGQVDDLAGEPPDSRRHLDPSGRAQIGLAGGVVASVTPAGGPLPAFEIIGQEGRLLALNDARQAMLWRTAEAGQPRVLDLPPPGSDWPEGPAAVRDLVAAVRGRTATACDHEPARRATEIGFAVHASHAVGGARVALPLADRTQRIASFPWGNEPAAAPL